MKYISSIYHHTTGFDCIETQSLNVGLRFWIKDTESDFYDCILDKHLQEFMDSYEVYGVSIRNGIMMAVVYTPQCIKWDSGLRHKGLYTCPYGRYENSNRPVTHALSEFNFRWFDRYMTNFTEDKQVLFKYVNDSLSDKTKITDYIVNVAHRSNFNTEMTEFYQPVNSSMMNIFDISGKLHTELIKRILVDEVG